MSSFTAHKSKFKSPSIEQRTEYVEAISEMQNVSAVERQYLEHKEDLLFLDRMNPQTQRAINGGLTLNLRLAVHLFLLFTVLSAREFHWLLFFLGVNIAVFIEWSRRVGH